MRPWTDARVAAVRLAPERYPENAAEDGPIEAALSRVAGELGWSHARDGIFGGVIPTGARVLIKPNWVKHENFGPWGIEPLLTHASLIRAVTRGAISSPASEVRVGDAPLQGCDFDELLSVNGLVDWSAELEASEPRYRGMQDFRRTRSIVESGLRTAHEEQIPLDRFVLFDLGSDSLLEPITSEAADFRVTQYDPRYMAKTHSAGKHQYLIARPVMEADVIINLPKLKTHKKAGITCALKNLIGINGNKEFLPHHRVGGSETGGDCYPGSSRLKRWLEGAFDRLNMSRSRVEARSLLQLIRALQFAISTRGDELGIEGSWSGNDTIWRTCLDLNRILLYGRADGTMAEEPQRRVIHITDAVIAGQGDGPLASEPLPMGLLLGSGSAVAMDWVGSLLLGYEPRRLPISRESFGVFRWPISFFGPEEVALTGDLGSGSAESLVRPTDLPYEVRHPTGWRDAGALKAAS